MRASVVASTALVLSLGLPTVFPAASPQPSAGNSGSFSVVATGDGCPEEKRLCYEIENVPSELTPGEEVSIRFENRGNASHTLYVANGSRADTDRRDTSAAVALARTDEVEPGDQATLNVTVPDGDSLYLWCEIDDHEADGMWSEVPVGASSENASGPEQGSKRTPSVGAAAVLAVAGGVAVVARGRR